MPSNSASQYRLSDPRSDQLVPYAATKWLERSLPSCTSTVIPGGTHALVYDKGSMEEVFTAAQKGLQEARVSKERWRR